MLGLSGVGRGVVPVPLPLISLPCLLGDEQKVSWGATREGRGDWGGEGRDGKGEGILTAVFPSPLPGRKHIPFVPTPDSSLLTVNQPETGGTITSREKNGRKIERKYRNHFSAL